MRINRTNNKHVWNLIEKLVCRATTLYEESNETSDDGHIERAMDEQFSQFCAHLKENIMTSSSNEMATKEVNQQTTIPMAPSMPPNPLFAELNLSFNKSFQQRNLPPPAPPLPPHYSNNKLVVVNVDTTKQSPHQQQQQQQQTNSPSNNRNTQPPMSPVKQQSSTDNQRTDLAGNSQQQQLELKLPQQCVPRPSIKMKSIAWSKIHPNRIVGKNNLWTRFNNLNTDDSLITLDPNASSVEELNYFQEIEELFKTVENSGAANGSDANSNSVNLSKDQNLREHKMWNSSEKINLLDSKRSLNINIYLKQFRWFVLITT